MLFSSMGSMLRDGRLGVLCNDAVPKASPRREMSAIKGLMECFCGLTGGPHEILYWVLVKNLLNSACMALVAEVSESEITSAPRSTISC